MHNEGLRGRNDRSTEDFRRSLLQFAGRTTWFSRGIVLFALSGACLSMPRAATAATVQGTVAGCGHKLPGYRVVAFTEVRPSAFSLPVVREVGRADANADGFYSIAYARPSGWSTKVFVQVIRYSGAVLFTSPKYAIGTSNNNISPDICNPTRSGPFETRSRFVEIDISRDVVLPPYDDGNLITCADRGVVYQKPANNKNKAIVYYPVTNSDPSTLAPGSFPVILLGHGQRAAGCGQPTDNRSDYLHFYHIAQRLVSWGFVVVSVDLHWLTPLFRSDVDDYNRMRLLQDALDYMSRQRCVRGGLFYNKLELTKVGGIGHSMGALAVLELASEDARVDAMALLGPAIPRATYDLSPRPLMTVMGTLDVAASIRDFNLDDPSAPESWGTDRMILRATGPSKYGVRITNGNHFNYTDGIRDVPQDRDGVASQRSSTQTYLAAFFQRHLKCANASAVNSVLRSKTSVFGGTSIHSAAVGSSGCYSLNPTPGERVMPACFSMGGVLAPLR